MDGCRQPIISGGEGEVAFRFHEHCTRRPNLDSRSWINGARRANDRTDKATGFTHGSTQSAPALASALLSPTVLLAARP